jgi:TPR repeat protein
MNFKEEVVFGIFDWPSEIALTPFHGLIGWTNIQCNILWIDAEKKVMTGLDRLPADIETWAQWPIMPDSTLVIGVRDAAGQEGSIVIDTGDPFGISLNSARWNEWKVNNEGQPYTLSATYTPAVGWKVYEEYQADTLAIEDFTVSDIPVRLSDAVWEQAYPNYQATLGLFALSRLDVIIDGPGGNVYTRPKINPQSIYPYSRTGAAFIPMEANNGRLVAYVVENGPAYQAGLRNGDILLEVNGQEVAKWKSDLTESYPFRKHQAGKKVYLSVMREDRPLSVVIELADIAPQNKRMPHKRKQHASSADKDFSLKPIVFCEESNILKRTNQYRQAAEQGDVQAQYNLGLAYANGNGLPQDYIEATKWLLMAAEQGHTMAQYGLGVMYRDGQGVEQDYTKAAAWFLKAARQQDAMAQNNLAAMYSAGQGVEQDYTEAVKWFLTAAQQGLAMAQNNLGVMYRDGLGVEQDYTEAAKWFHKAAQQGYAMAQHDLGIMYRDGLGVDQDYAEAAKWLLMAAEQGDALAQNILGVYLNGFGVIWITRKRGSGFLRPPNRTMQWPGTIWESRIGMDWASIRITWRRQNGFSSPPSRDMHWPSMIWESCIGMDWVSRRTTPRRQSGFSRPPSRNMQSPKITWE